MPGPRGLNIQQHAVFEGALFDEIEIGVADLRPIRVVDEHQATRPEKRLGQREPVELILVCVRPVEQIQPQCFFVPGREVLPKIPLAKDVL